MTKAELIKRMYEGINEDRVELGENRIKKKDVEECVDAMIKIITATLRNGEEVKLYPLGSFKVKTRKSRKVRNFRTGKEMIIPNRKVPVFVPSKRLKDLVEKTYPEATEKIGM